MLDRLARAFGLTEEEREHLYLLAQQRPPKVRASARAGVTPQLQGVLDALVHSPAIVKAADWTVLAWNRAATRVLADYSRLPEGERNALRLLFREGGHDHLPDWESVARQMLGTVRRDILRAGMQAETQSLIDDLSRDSAEFRRLWAEHDVTGYGEGAKAMRHASAGMLSFDYSTFAVEGRPDLALVVFNPSSDADREKVRALLGG